MKRHLLSFLCLSVLSLPAWGVQYSYDDLNRLTRVAYDNGASIDYGYDASGNLLLIARVSGSATPGAPMITHIVGGNGLLRIFFAPPASSGAYAIAGYAAICTPTTGGPAVSASGTGSPLVVTGLVNRTAYTCSVHASNPAGMGAESSNITRKAGASSVAAIVSVILSD